MATRKITNAEPFLPKGKRTLPKLRGAAADCQGCDLYLHATQTVFGEGNVKHFKFEERGKPRHELVEDLRLVASRLNVDEP